MDRANQIELRQQIRFWRNGLCAAVRRARCRRMRGAKRYPSIEACNAMGFARAQPSYVLSLFSHFSHDARGTTVERWTNSTFNLGGGTGANRRFAQNEGTVACRTTIVKAG
jgi:hypothetical protein